LKNKKQASKPAPANAKKIEENKKDEKKQAQVPQVHKTENENAKKGEEIKKGDKKPAPAPNTKTEDLKKKEVAKKKSRQ